jgi:hypothetical protein
MADELARTAKYEQPVFRPLPSSWIRGVGAGLTFVQPVEIVVNGRFDLVGFPPGEHQIYARDPPE